MLGWPSLGFPHLLNNVTTPIFITLDQTSLIAGFLMEGNTFGTLFCTTRFVNSKTAVSASLFLQIAGWFIMFGANSVIGLFFSRFLVGIGNGLGLPQLKIYVKETCNNKFASLINKHLIVGINVGIVIIYIFGLFLTFRQLALASMAFPIFGFVLFTFIPKYKTPQEKFIEGLPETRPVEEKIITNEQWNIIKILKDSKARNSIIFIFFVVFLIQYTGGAANVVYSQIVFLEIGNPYPKVCSVIYACSFLMSILFSLKYTPKFPIKIMLLISILPVFFLNCLMSLYFYTKHYLLNISEYFTWGPLFILCLYIFFHTLGLTTVPFVIVDTKVPNYAKDFANQVLVIDFSLSAVISTKFFQLSFTYGNMCIAYLFLASVAFSGFIIILLFVKNVSKSVDLNKNNKLPTICTEL